MSRRRPMNFGRFDYATFLTFFVYAASSLVVPVALVVLARDLGFSLEKGGMTAGGLLQLGRSTPMVFAMALCGFAAGRWGKRHIFGYSVLLMGLGLGICAFAPTYGILFLALMLAGLGEGVIEGLATPFVQELHQDDHGRHINFSHGFWSVGVLVTVLVSGAALTWGVSWRVLVGAVALTAVVPALMLLLPPSKGHPLAEHREPLHWTTVCQQAAAIVRLPRFGLYFAAMFLAGGGEFCLTFWCASYIQLNLSPSAWAGGLGTAFFAAGMVAGRTSWGLLVPQRHLKRLIVASAVGGTLVTLLLPMTSGFWLFCALLFLAGVATAPFWPSLMSHCAECLKGVDTTMLFILLSCAGVPGCGFFAWLMGYIGNHGGLNAAFYLVPACYGLLGLLVAFDGKRLSRNNLPA